MDGALVSLAFPTGVTEDRPCKVCGVVCRHDETDVSTAKGIVRWWDPVRHAAACGTACLGGGVSPQQYRAGQVHGASRDGTTRHCPICGSWQDAPDK